MNRIVEIQSQSRLWNLNLVNSASGTEKLSIWPIVPQELKNSQSLHSFKKKYKESETKLSMSVMQNLLATCWFYIIILCGNGRSILT